MDHEGDLPLVQPKCHRGVLVEYLLHHLDLQEVVARAERAHLVQASLPGAGADALRICPGETASGLGVFKVSDLTVASLHGPSCALHHDAFKLGPAQFGYGAGRAHPSRNVAEELVDGGTQSVLHIGAVEGGGEQAYAAVDVVSDAAGGYDTGVHAESGDPSDGEAVAEVDVGHGHGETEDPR